MKFKLLLLSLLTFCSIAYGDVKLSDLPLTSDATTIGTTDSFPYTSVANANATRRFYISSILNTPAFTTKFNLLAPKASPTFTGIVTGTFSGNLTGDVTGTASGNTTYSPNQYGLVISGSANAMSVVPPDASTTKVLVSGGLSSAPLWSYVTDGITVGTLDGGTLSANGASVSSGSLFLQSATGTYPGLVNTSSQTFAGAKTFSSTIVGSISGNAATVTTNANLTGDVTSSGNATSYSAVVPLAKGGTHADLSSTGGTSQVLRQSTLGADVSVSQLACSDLSNSAASCATDATNATNITTGTLPAGRLPNPTSSTLGGVESLAAVTNNFLTSISTSGVPAQARPTCSNLSDSVASCSTDTTNAANISTGLLGLARGGVHTSLAATGGTSQVLKQITTGADITVGQLACADLSNSAASCATDATNAANIGSGLLALARGGTHTNLSATGGTSQVLKQVTTGADITVAQLACSDLSNAATSCATDTTNATNITTGTLGSTVQGNITTVGTIGTGTWAGTAVAVNHGGTGNTTYTDGQLLIGNSSGNTLTKATLSAGANITITNGNGSISIAASSAATPSYNYTSQTTTYSAVIGDYVLASSASFTITLPTAVSQAGKDIFIQHNGTSLSAVYTLNTTSSQTINSAGGTVASGVYKLVTNGEVVDLRSDGANWQVIEHRTITGENVGGALTITGSTTNPTKGTISYDTFTWWRVGSYMHYRYDIKQTVAGSAGSGDYIVAFPANVTVDTTNLQVNATVNTTNNPSSYSVIGSGMNYDSVNNNYAMAYLKDSTHFKVAFAGSGTWGAGVKGFGGANEILSIQGSFPVSTWQP